MPRSSTATVSQLSAQPTRRTKAASTPLGSLTQRGHRSGPVCAACGSPHVTRLALTLADGTPVDFTSCHRCEHRRWENEGSVLSMQSVVQRSRRTA